MLQASARYALSLLHFAEEVYERDFKDEDRTAFYQNVLDVIANFSELRGQVAKDSIKKKLEEFRAKKLTQLTK